MICHACDTVGAHHKPGCTWVAKRGAPTVHEDWPRAIKEEAMTPDEHYHQFGHHPDDRDPWDALLLDVSALDDSGEFKALVTFWAKRGKEQQERERLTVERIRAAVREMRAIDWTEQDDLSRYARELLINLTIGPTPKDES